jgi:threonine dehydrogenase-like Zn-dependent dehydrogenase
VEEQLRCNKVWQKSGLIRHRSNVGVGHESVGLPRRGDVRCDTVLDPKIEDDRDVIIKVTACAICGSDLHLIGGFVPEMKAADVLGHECMG